MFTYTREQQDTNVKNGIAQEAMRQFTVHELMFGGRQPLPTFEELLTLYDEFLTKYDLHHYRLDPEEFRQVVKVNGFLHTT
jgi:hypothetical protein